MGDNNTTRPKRRWVSPVKELGGSSPRIGDGSQESAEIAGEQQGETHPAASSTAAVSVR